MEKNRSIHGLSPCVLKMLRIMKLTVFLMLITFIGVFASETYSQTTKLSLKAEKISLEEFLIKIEEQSEFRFFYTGNIDVGKKVSGEFKDQKITEILDKIKKEAGIKYEVIGRQIILSPVNSEDTIKSIQQQKSISGVVTDESGELLPGVTVLVKGTNQGTVTNTSGQFTISGIPENTTLQFSFIGMQKQEIELGDQTKLDVTMKVDAIGIEEVVAVGYGTMKKIDLTGSVTRVRSEELQEKQNVSLMESLHGSIPGLNIGQVNRAGGQPSISIRGTTSISGVQSPLIVLDGVIFRGNIIDININDVESVDVLKDASAAAVYGSQASNGVIIITSKKGKGGGKPIINYTASYSFQQPSVEFLPESPEEYLQRVRAGYFLSSRTPESGYLDDNPNWNINTIFRTTDKQWAYENGITTNWYDILTNKNVYTNTHNLSLTQNSGKSSYFMSLGYTDQGGYMVNEDYSKWNARINIDNAVTDWFDFGVQTFMTSSDYSGYELDRNYRYENDWYAPAYDQNGDLVVSPRGLDISPLYYMEADDLNKRLNLFGNAVADIRLPFIKGLSFKTNFNINYLTNSHYFFMPWAESFTGKGSKEENRRTEWTNDNILSYKNTFAKIHKVDITLVYGEEKRVFTGTTASATNFVSQELGYNRLEAGSSELQKANSNAWQEASLYNMGRFFYSYRDKYMFTGTVRRDGFSGFSEKNKFGVFPSAALGWVVSEESFVKNNFEWVSFLKLRATYGSNGNRTIGRYQTMAVVNGNFGYVNGNVPLYTQGISSLESPDLKWETTTGINLGLDFSVLNQRVSGSIEYYNNNTHDLLYNVDIPSISRYSTFPDNLGKLHNNGFEFSLNSTNLEKGKFKWTSQFVFARNRNELRQLLGRDDNKDGIEDDLISEKLFIGEPLGVVYDYSVSGKMYQIGDEIPTTADIGTFVIDDLNKDEVITPEDKTILGYTDPSYVFSIENRFKFKNWSLSVFVNSKQGGKKYYMGADNLFNFIGLNNTLWDSKNFPASLDFWTPENPNARYQRQGAAISSGLRGSRYETRSFIRIQDFNLSYNVDKKTLKKLKLEGLRLFFNGKNLWTFTKWNGWDPETGQDINMGGRPVMRNYTLGIDLKF